MQLSVDRTRDSVWVGVIGPGAEGTSGPAGRRKQRGREREKPAGLEDLSPNYYANYFVMIRLTWSCTPCSSVSFPHSSGLAPKITLGQLPHVGMLNAFMNMTPQTLVTKAKLYN